MGEAKEAGHAHDRRVVHTGHRAAGSGDPVFDHDGLVGGGVGADFQPKRDGAVVLANEGITKHETHSRQLAGVIFPDGDPTAARIADEVVCGGQQAKNHRVVTADVAVLVKIILNRSNVDLRKSRPNRNQNIRADGRVISPLPRRSADLEGNKQAVRGRSRPGDTELPGCAGLGRRGRDYGQGHGGQRGLHDGDRGRVLVVDVVGGAVRKQDGHGLGSHGVGLDDGRDDDIRRELAGEDGHRAGERGEVAAADGGARDEVIDEQIIGGVAGAFDRDAPRRAVAASYGIRRIHTDLRQVVVDDENIRRGKPTEQVVGRVRLNGEGRRFIALHEQIIDGVDRQEDKILPRRNGDGTRKRNKIHSVARHAAHGVADGQFTVIGGIEADESDGRAISARFNRVTIKGQDSDSGLKVGRIIPLNAQRGLGPRENIGRVCLKPCEGVVHSNGTKFPSGNSKLIGDRDKDAVGYDHRRHAVGNQLIREHLRDAEEVRLQERGDDHGLGPSPIHGEEGVDEQIHTGRSGGNGDLTDVDVFANQVRFQHAHVGHDHRGAEKVPRGVFVVHTNHGGAAQNISNG